MAVLLLLSSTDNNWCYVEGCAGVLEPRRGDPAQVSTREEAPVMSTLRLHREAGFRQVQGVGEVGTRQNEWR